MRRFRFGRNWVKYVRNVVGREIVDTARDSLLRYLPLEKYRQRVIFFRCITSWLQRSI